MKIRNLKHIALIALALIAAISLSSCKKTIGYSVVLWGDEKNNLTTGEIVKVLVKSNITKTYIIELPTSEENKEIPLWQLSEPESKSKAKKTAAIFAEYANTFASVKLDGLPIRAEPINTSKQVYRLRKNEIIRVLFKGEGTAVNSMEGEWYRVLTKEGTQGWCFSFNLDIYESENGGKRDLSVAAKDEGISKDDEKLVALRTTRWHPGEYKQLLKKKTYDLKRMNEKFGLFLDEDAQKISFATSEDEKSWTFSGIKEASKKQLKFEGANVSVTIKSDDEIVLQYTENGKPKNVVFVSFDSDITKIIEAERNRRQNALEKIAKVGPRFSSENYGTLIISSGEGEKYNFYWDNFKLLQPSIIPSSANTRGTVSIDYLIPDSMKANYDGLLTFDFGSEYEVNFLYKLTDSGLRLEDAVRGKIEGGILKAKSSSPTVIFLEK